MSLSYLSIFFGNTKSSDAAASSIQSCPIEVTSESSSPTIHPIVVVGKDEWQCQCCTLINKRSRPGCSACGNERPLEAMPEDGPERHFYLDAQKYIPSEREFECPVCFVDIAPEDGVQLRECHCEICMSCLEHGIKSTKNGQFGCPKCGRSLCERDMRNAVSPGDWEKFQSFMLKHVEAKTSTSFHCLTPDCIGWVEVVNDESPFFMCPCCKKVNCVACKALHEGKTCEDYRKTKDEKDIKKSKDFLQKLLDEGKAMECPDCKSIIQRIDGCGYLDCSRCGLPLCWYTKQRRWGPKGKGDTSDGCRCKVNGKRCHKDCTWCDGH